MSAGRRCETLDVDLAAGVAEVMGDEARKRGGRGEPVEQAARESAVQDADDVLVLAHRVAIGTVGQPADQSSLRLMVDLGLKAERGQHVADGLNGGGGGCRSELPPDLAAGRLGLVQTRGCRGNGAGEPAG